MDQSLRTRWHSSVSCLTNELLRLHNYSLGCESQKNALDALSQHWLEKVSELYAQPHRAYHNMTHIQDVIASLDFLLERRECGRSGASLVYTKPDNEEAILVLAAFFHDVIYNPKSSTNEKDSADLFLQFVSELLAATSSSQTTQQQENSTSSGDGGSPEEQSCINCDIVVRTEECIIATATHIASAAQAHETQNHTLATFLDADMSILGKDSDAYNNYAGCIRREYQFVERNVYCEKRADILESFLPLTDKTTEGESNSSVPIVKKHSYIYATEKGRQRWEEQARRNLKNEIEMLRRKVIPCEEQK